MKNGFIKTAACSPALRVADCNYNAEKIIEAMQAHADVQLLVFPEFSLTGYTCGDLFLQHTLLQGAEAALEKVIAASEGLAAVSCWAWFPKHIFLTTANFTSAVSSPPPPKPPAL